MSSDVVRHAARMWERWFPGEPSPSLEAVLTAGGPAHGERAIVFLFSGRERRPRVVLKIALSDLEAGYLSNELQALQKVQPTLSAELADSVPRPLGGWRSGDTQVIATEALDGRRLLIPHLSAGGSPVSRHLMKRYFGRTFDWSRALGIETRQHESRDERHFVSIVDRFAAAFEDRSRLACEAHAFGRALGRQSITWSPSWQHGDVSLGNVLKHRGRLQFVDWEHASSDSEPWFDIAYAPASLAMLARGRKNMDGMRPAVLSVLDPTAWLGSILRYEMQAAWTYPLPLPWGVTLAAMRVVLRRRGNGRLGWPMWLSFVELLLTDRDVRTRLEWLAPEW